jgi:alkanesulfonate monooxygenase SsuD/methylene tetrahydromethanopterin reductase-like flavin-dependent oxidoreductase (luciferase family)
LKFDILCLGDHLPDPHTGRYVDTQSERHRMWADLAVHAEALGYDAYWLGEHHTSDYVMSSPQMVLAAAAVKTERIRLGTGVSLLPNHDPVRLAEDFATLDLLSRGRAEIGFGGGFTAHTFRLFGQRVEDGPALAAENLDLLERLWSERRVDWQGRFRAPLETTTVQPRTFTGRAIPINRAVASNEATARDAGRRGHKIMCMTIVGTIESFAPLATAYRETYLAAGHDPAGMSVAAVCRVHVQRDGVAAIRFWRPYLENYMRFTRILQQERGVAAGLLQLMESLRRAPSRPNADFRFDDFATMCGDPGQVADTIVNQHRRMGGIDRLMCYFDLGGVARDVVFDTVALFAREVAPRVRDAIG